ncbi:MAG: CPBP family intramembrane metalloprotease [Lachnospiraceae bacterium]|nr:CPBP family intramembrane metalloprotease [Lachnospiraceae bacterium]
MNTADNARSETSGLGWLFFISMFVHLLAMLGFNLLSDKGFEFPVEVTLVVSELTILIPAVIYVLVKNLDLRNDLGFRRLKPGTVLMCILLTMFVSPVASFVNVVSQLFVSNTMTQMSDTLLGGSGIAVWFLTAVYGPFCEEFVFRGIFCNRYEQYVGPLRAGFISAMLFGLAHMNINQAAYVFVLSVIFSIINRAAGSVLPSLIIHMCINGFNMLMMFAMAGAAKSLGRETDLAQAAELARGSDILYMMIAVTFVISIISIAIAIPCVVWIAKHEDNFEALHDMFANKHENAGWLRVSTVLGICLVLFVMFGLPQLLEIIDG